MIPEDLAKALAQHKVPEPKPKRKKAPNGGKGVDWHQEWLKVREQWYVSIQRDFARKDAVDQMLEEGWSA